MPKFSRTAEPEMVSAGEVLSCSQPTIFGSIVGRWWKIGVIVFLVMGASGAVLKYLDEDAQSQKLLAAKDRSAISSINPFVPAALPVATPQLSKEYIYAGSRMLAAVDAGANAAPPADLAVWRPSSGVWYVLGGAGSAQTSYGWGTSGDVPLQGDFDGDGKTDFAIYRPSSGAGNSSWWVTKSSDNTYYSVTFGSSADIAAPADFDGDGRTDIAVWRPSTGMWYIVQSSNGTTIYPQYGSSGDQPKPSDFDGDGKADLAVWRDNNRTFYSLNSSNSQSTGYGFANLVTSGTAATPVSSDYDGDGKADYAIRSGANWIIVSSATSATSVTAWQLASDIPVQNDYDGDGKTDLATWRPSNGNWYIRQSATNNSLRQEAWGTTGDIPVPAFYRR